MPKIKTNKAAAKRFRVTARGKVMYARAGRRHLLSSKSAKRRRQLRKSKTFGGANVVAVRRLLLRGLPTEGRPPQPPAGPTP